MTSSSKVVPFDPKAGASAQPMEVINISQRSNNSGTPKGGKPASVRLDASTKEGSSDRVSGMRGASTRGASSRKTSKSNRTELLFASTRVIDKMSGRGHDLNGGGLHIGHGQLEQAKDRNFQAALDRCRVATESMAGLRPVVCAAACGELQSLVAQVAGMLKYLQHIFHDDTKKTIVSLKQLTNQLEAADRAAAPLAKAPSVCSRLCGGAAEAERDGNAMLQMYTKAVKTYAVSLLLEHGFQATDLAALATRSLPATIYSTDRGGTNRAGTGREEPIAEGPERISEGQPHAEEEDTTTCSATPKYPPEEPRKLSLDNAVAGVLT